MATEPIDVDAIDKHIRRERSYGEPGMVEGEETLAIIAMLRETQKRAETAEDVLRWLVSLDDPDPDSQGFQDRKAVTLNQIIGRAREALGITEED